MTINRRTLLAAGGLSALAAPALAQIAGAAPAAPPPGAAPGAGRGPAGPPAPPPTLTVPLWPGQPPGFPAGGFPAQAPAMPSLDLYRAADPDGSAVIICPGGGYATLVTAGEGALPAGRFAADRMTAFVLRYRLPGQGWTGRSAVPLQDAQRAIRLVRSRAQEWGIDPARVGIMGFSAGGHVAATLATSHGEATYARLDAVDDQSARPFFAALIYPVITMQPAWSHKGSVNALLGPNAGAELMASRSAELQVTADTAPCFIAQGQDDMTVPVENSIMMMQALREKKIRNDTHLFQEGRHGFYLGTPGQGTQDWPDMFERWVRRLSA